MQVSLSLDSCQNRFLWANKEDNLAPRPVIGFELQIGDVEKFFLAHLVWTALIFSPVSVSRVHVSQQYRRVETTRERSVQLALTCLADGVASPVCYGHRCHG